MSDAIEYRIEAKYDSRGPWISEGDYDTLELAREALKEIKKDILAEMAGNQRPPDLFRISIEKKVKLRIVAWEPTTIETHEI